MIKSFVILVLTVLLFLASFGYVVFRLQDPHFVVEQSRSVNLYSRLTGNVAGFLPSDEIERFGLEPADVTEILKSGIDGERFYDFLTKAGEAYLPWLTGKTATLSFSYSLQETKLKLADATSARILTKYNSLPTCTSVELRDWSFDESMPTCQLANGTLKAKSITNLANQAATRLTDQIPDSISASQPSQQLLEVRTNVALAFKMIFAIWGATLLLLLLYLLIWRSAGLISLSICFLLVGLLQIAFSLIGWDWITKTIGEFVGGSGEAKSVVPIIIDLVSVMLGAMKSLMGNISVGFLGSGVAMLIWGIFSKIHHSALIPKVVK